MKYTNKYGLPQSFYNAIVNNNKKRGEYLSETKAYITTTGFTRGICETHLHKRHSDKLESDVSDNIWSLFGSAVHQILENNADDIEVSEVPLTTEICGLVIAGIPDVYDKTNKILSDYKVTKVYGYILGDKTDYEIQLNINAYLLELAGHQVDKLEIVYMFKDFSKMKAKTDSNYPQCDVMRYSINKWEREKTIHFIENSLNNIIKYENVPDNELPICSEHQRWHKDDKYAVKKKGRKSAVRVLDSNEDAEKYIVDKNLDSKHSIEYRIGEDTKCAEYCDVNMFCPHYNKDK
jgi:hypothetical protein